MNVQAFGIACVATLTLAISGANAQILYLYDDEANRSTELRLYDLETQKSEVIITGGLYQWNDLMGSPDGSAVLFQEFRGEFNDIGVVSASGGKVTHLTNRNGDNRDGAWSPDSDQIAFSSNRDDDYEIYAMDADGGNVHRLTNHQFAASWPSWSPDGREIAYVTSDYGQTDSLYVMKA
ncbi:MAG: hypothetical protein O3A46_12930, partial [Candidatus Poribacteria bacterium]|nr:hypothetical protein [Candidatus Poribacteria bacterium]